MHRTLRQEFMRGAAYAALAGLALAASLTGCRIQTQKGANGEDKKVQIDTPFGGVHVDTDQTSAADLGLPAYPGSQVVRDKSDSQSADIHMGFGEWELRVRVVSYSTPDSEDKVVAFYRKALGRYGDVIACQGDTPVGTPTSTGEGLTCADNGKNTKVQINSGDFGTGKDNFQLKAGSKRHQHIVGFESSAPGQTRFSLVALDLPVGLDNSGKSD